MTKGKHVHFIGIGGTGISAIARVLLESGYQVSGSDRTLSPMAKGLQAEGARIDIGHRAESVTGAEVVVRSSAVPDDNAEVVAARAQGIPVLKRSEFLSSLMEDRMAIAVAGTHGKTTTTAMIAWMLTALGQEPTFICGGVLNNLETNAHAGKGEAFVIEADEYDHMFLGLKPRLAVVTNIEHDHPDCYPTPQDFFQAFSEFASQVTSDGTLLVCANDRGAAQLGKIAKQRRQKVLTYALGDNNDGDVSHTTDYVADQLQANPQGGMTFDAHCSLPGKQFDLPKVASLRVPGKHNAQNALAALAVAHQLNLSVEQAGQALSDYSGTGRRFEVRGQVNGITVIDDYAHHPTEIRATLSAARSRYPKGRLWVVWQPHTYSRTRLLLKDFSAAFEEADMVVVTGIYAAREKAPEDGFSALQVVEAMTFPPAKYIPDFSQVTRYLVEHLEAGDTLLVLSAGDADQISTSVLARLNERSR